MKVSFQILFLLSLSWVPSLFPKSITCGNPVNAYDPGQPDKLIGQFLAGSVLEIGESGALSGFHQVTFHESHGGNIVALCKDADLGLSPTSPHEPTSLSPSPTPPRTGVDLNSKPLRVLFIGNSFTDAYKMPLQIQQLASAAKENRPMEAVMVTRPAFTLKKHLDEGEAMKRIREKGWDYVVLQANSSEPFHGTGTMENHLKTFDTEIRRVGAKTVLYMTWADKNAPGKQSTITHAYRSCANGMHSFLAPIGDAWEKEWKSDHGIDLYSSDKHHPNAAGSYLSACVFYALFYSKSPEGLPHFLHDPENAKEMLNTVFPTEAKHLQQIAWETAQNEHWSTPTVR